VSHYLGLLAATTGQAGHAIRHFEEAIELEEQIGALPYLAHSLHGLAAALTARAGPGDAGRAARSQDRARGIAERLGLTHLLDRLARSASEWSLTKDGDDWVLEAGGERARLRDGRGLHYLRALLAAPGRDIPALDLASGGGGLAAAGAGGTGPVLDAADRAGDGAAVARLEAERQALIGELSRAAGLAGRNQGRRI
jgi:hypothetical protein